MTRNRATVLSGDDVFPDNYGKGFQGCYEAMRAGCKHVHRYSAENMRCGYDRDTDIVCPHYPRCAPHFAKCPRLFGPVPRTGHRRALHNDADASKCSRMMEKKYLHNGKCYKAPQLTQEYFDDFLSVLAGFPSDPEYRELMVYETWKSSINLYIMTIGVRTPAPSPDEIPDTRDSLRRLIHTVWYNDKHLTSAIQEKIEKCVDAVLWQIDWRRRNGYPDEFDGADVR